MPAQPAERTATAPDGRSTSFALRLGSRLAQNRVALAVLAGLLGGLVAFWLRTIPIISDPWNYIHAGETFPQVTWNMVGLTRYGVILPLIPVTRLFHDSELAYVLTPLLATAVLLGCSFWLAARFFSKLAGWATVVALLACSPILTFASRTYPDIFSASTTVAAVTLAVAARDAGRGGRSSLRSTLLLVATGLMVGLSWWMRETSLLSWPTVAAVLLWRGGPGWRRVAALAGGAAAVMFGLECLISELAFDDWFARIHALTGSSMAGTVNPQDLHYLNQSRLTYAGTVGRVMLAQPDGPILIAEAILAVTGAVLLRNRGTRLFGAWFISTMVLLILAGGALRPSNPSLRLDLVRYWLPFLAPMVIGAVGSVAVVLRMAVPALHPWWAADRRRRYGAGLLATCLLLLVPVIPTAHHVRNDPEFVVSNHGVMDQFRDWIGAHPEISVMYGDIATARQLPTYARTFAGRALSDVTFRSYGVGTPGLPGPPPPGSYVVLFSEGQQYCGFCAEWIREFRAGRPHQIPRWEQIWKSPDGAFKVYRVPEKQP